MKRKLLFAIVALLCSVGVWAETDYTSLMSSDWTGSTGGFQGGKERYQDGAAGNYTAEQKVLYQSFTAPATGIYEIKFYAVTSSTSGRGFDNIWGDNIAQAYATAGSNKATVAMTVINQTGCTLVADANIRTLSVEAAEGETIEYGLENIATGGNWYTIKELSAKMKTVAEIFQAQYDEAYAIWEHSTENETGAKATFKTYVDAMNTALSGTLAEAQTASDNLAAALVTYESKSYPVKGSGVKYDFTSKMNMAINAWTCVLGNGPAQYGFTGATETYGVNAAGEVMYQTITGLANGEYEIHFYAVANAANGGGTASDASSKKVYAYANDQTLDIAVIQQNSCTPSEYERTFTVMVKDGTIKYGITNNENAGNWYICKNVALYMTGAPDLSDYYDAISANLTTANGLLSSKMCPTASSGLTTAISNAAGYDNITVIGTLETINQNIVDAISAANISIADYANLAAAITAASNKYSPLDANAAAYNTAISDAQAVYDNATVDDCAATIASLNTAFQTANVADFNYVKTNYPYAVNLGTWTKVNAGDRSSQHWDGTSTSTYSEQNEGWGNSSWSCSYSQDLSLPAGKYVFKVAGRKSSNSATLTLEVKNGTTTIGTVSNFPDGDTGYGINKKGDASFDSEDAEGFAKNPNHTGDDLEGCGWQWRFVEFELSDPATVNVAVRGSASAQYQWVGFCNATVQTDDEDNVDIMTALVALNDAKTAATLTERTNKGTGVFQFDKTTDDGLWSAYSTAKSNADAFTLTASSTTEAVNALATALSTATTNYSSNAALVAPDASKRYTLTIVEDGKDWNGNAVTFIDGARSDMGGYGIKYLTPANANMNQALKFTAVDGETNTYKVSAINVADGGERYITTGTTYPDVEGNNNSQIRTTDDASKASWVKIQATETIGQFQLLNVSNGNMVIANSNNNDMYTANTANFTIAEASQAEVAVNVAADKYATRIFPFAPGAIDGITFYSCEAAENGELTLVEVATPAANVPYILLASKAVSTTLTGWGTASDTEYTAGWLTGEFAAKEITDGYVLQTLNEEQKFYAVDSSDPITVPAYRAYLTVSGGNNVKAFSFPGTMTAVEAIEAARQNGTIFNLAGQRVQKAQKGLYIVNGKKVLVK